MCANYRAVTDLQRIAAFFGITPGALPESPELDPEVYPVKVSGFIRLSREGHRILEAGYFGLLPHFAKELAYGRRTYNSRSETVDTLPSFRTSWKRGQRCIIPAEKIYEPCYETGKPVRWAIELPTATPMGIAGIWAEHPSIKMPDGYPLLSFSMLTVNADGQPVIQRMHAPEDEKRMVVILYPDEYDRWLSCRVADAPMYFRQYLGDLYSYAAPAPRRQPRATKGARGSDFPPLL